MEEQNSQAQIIFENLATDQSCSINYNEDRSKEPLSVTRQNLFTPEKDGSPEVKISVREDFEVKSEAQPQESKRTDLSVTIEQKLKEMKAQLGLDKHESQNEEFIEKMREMNNKLGFKHYVPKERTPHFEDTFGTNIEDNQSRQKSLLDYSSSKKYLDSDRASNADSSKFGHKKNLEGELSKLESRFFSLFQQEKIELLEKSNKDLEELENQVKRKYESTIKDLELRARENDTILMENEVLKREVQNLKRKEKMLAEENDSLRLKLKVEKDHSTELEFKVRVSQQSSTFEREKLLLDKIRELEISKSELEAELFNTKRQNSSKTPEKKSPGSIDRLHAKLRNYKDKCEQLSELNREYEYERSDLLSKVKTLETIVYSLKGKKKSTSNIKRDIKSASIEGNRSRSRSKNKLVDDSRMTTQDDSRSPLPRKVSRGSIRKTENDSGKKEGSREAKKNSITQSTELSELRNKNVELNEKNKNLENKLRLSPAPKSSTKKKVAEEYLEAKVIELHKDCDHWKHKCEILSSKYILVLNKLKEENEKLKANVFENYKQFRNEITDEAKKLKKLYKKVIMILNEIIIKKCDEAEDRVSYYQQKYSEYLANRSPPKQKQRDKSSSNKSSKKKETK